MMAASRRSFCSIQLNFGRTRFILCVVKKQKSGWNFSVSSHFFYLFTMYSAMLLLLFFPQQRYQIGKKRRRQKATRQVGAGHLITEEGYGNCKNSHNRQSDE